MEQGEIVDKVVRYVTEQIVDDASSVEVEVISSMNEIARIRSSDWFSFKNNGRISVDQRTINRVTVANCPTNVRSRPKGFSFICTVNIFY